MKQAKYLTRKVLERKFDAMREDNKGLRKRIYQLEQALKTQKETNFKTFKAAEILAIVGMYHIVKSEVPECAPEAEFRRIAGQLGIVDSNLEGCYAIVSKASEEAT